MQLIDRRRLVWDEWNRDHIARHGGTREDVDAVCRNDPVLYRESYKNRLVLLGRGLDGRVLAVVIGPVPKAHPGTSYPFTARPADRAECRKYHRQRGEPTP